jgi:TonB-linked SusC/RagA family outer membrane protein
MMTVTATSLAQQSKFNLKVSNANIIEVFESIEKQVDIGFVFQANQLDLNKRYSIEKNNITVAEVLAEVLSDASVQYRIIDNNVIIISKTLDNATNIQQKTTVKGTVTDASGEPLPGVNVYEKGTTNGVITGVDGTYSIDVANDNPVIVFSFIGFIAQEVYAQGRAEVNVTMLEEMTELDQVVVVGYGTMKKSDLTGSVASVSAEDFSNVASTSVDKMIQGRVAGVRINTTSGQPGAGTSIRIRGNSSLNTSNEPLYVIDGFPVSNGYTNTGIGTASGSYSGNPLNTINPSDIESIDILKDASATAIYGAQGANGVIIITTKRGKSGKISVNYDANFGVQKLARKVDVLNGQQYIEHTTEITGSVPEGFDDPSINNDWQSLLYHDKYFKDGKMASTTNHNVSLSGGNETVKVYGSVNYTNQEGIVDGSEYERFALRLNTDITKGRFNGKINLSQSLSNDDLAPVSGGFNLSAGISELAVYLPGSMPLYDENGNRFKPTDIDYDNPFDVLDANLASERTSRTMGNIDFTYDILNGLKANVKVSTDFTYARKDAYTTVQAESGAATNGSASIGTTERANVVYEGLLTYVKKFGDHNINAVAGSTMRDNYWRTFSGSAQGFVTDYTLSNDIGGGDPDFNRVDSYKSKTRLLSHLARVNYTYKDKVLVTGTIRADGLDRLADGNKWGYFPSFSVGYRLSQEDFMQGVSFLDNLKIRAGWGQIGNSSGIGSWPYLLYSRGGSPVFAGKVYRGIRIPGQANPDLKWEASEQLNFGVDFAFLGSRINGAVDFYSKSTRDLLYDKELAPSVGSHTTYVKVNDPNSNVSNKGVELSLNTINIATSSFEWETNLNVTYNQNEVKDFTNPQYTLSTDYASFVIREGDAAFSYYGLQKEGIWQIGQEAEIANSAQPNAEPGHVRWKDVNGDGVINSDDYVVLGNPYPDWSWGLTNTFRYKGLELSVFLEGVQGMEMFNYQNSQTYRPFNPERNRMSAPVLNRWTPDNPTNKYPSLIDPTKYILSATNSMTIEDASYIRLSDIKLSYNWNVKRIPFLSSLNTYVSASNLKLWTDYSGYDPDLGANGNRRQDINSYPSVSTIIFGLNVGF